MKTDKALDKAVVLIEGIFDSHFAGSKELSEAYIKKQYREDLSRLGLMKSENYRQAYNDKKKTKGDFPDYVIRMMVREINEHENRRKEMMIRLSNKTRSPLKRYKKDLVNKLLDVLIDFEEAVVLSKAVTNTFKILAKIQHRCVLAVQGADVVTDLVIELASAPEVVERFAPKDVTVLEKSFLARFEGRERSHAEELLDLARTSYRTRDNDNIYLGRIKGQAIMAIDEYLRRFSKDGSIS